MRFKILVVLVIFVFCVYDFAYAHSGRTNSAGCHNVTATGGYHCHGGSSGSSGSSGYNRSSRYSQSDNDVYLLLGLVVIVVGVGYWAYTTDWGKNPQGCFLSRSLDNQPLTRGLFDRTPMRIPVHDFKLPVLNLDRQGMSGWQLSAAYTFRF